MLLENENLVNEVLKLTTPKEDGIDDKLKSLGVDENRVTPDQIKSKIANVDMVKISYDDCIIRQCIITMRNGFRVLGKESVAVNVNNDRVEVGQHIAWNNAFNELFKLEGYLKKNSK